MLRLIVGLGNPGQQYRNNRHNYGFLWLDALLSGAGAGWQTRFGAEYAPITLASGARIIAMKPQEMMNCSGTAVGKFSRYYNIAPEEILLAHDELDLPLGRVRVKKGGGAAGHNGIRDTIRHIGADFHRLRLGIDHPGNKDLVHQHVLSNFRPEEREIVDRIIRDLCCYTDLLVTEQFTRFQNHFHQKEKP